MGSGMLPTEDFKAIYAHLAAHLKDAQREPPELRAMGDARYPLDDQIELASGSWKMSCTRLIMCGICAAVKAWR